MPATTSVPRARDEENRFSCSFIRGGPIGKVLVRSNRLFGQSCTLKCLHQQGIITARIIYIQRKVKQTNGKENVMIHKYQAYIFPKGKQSKMYMTKFVLAGSQGMLSMITQIIEGQRWYFSP